MRNLKKVLALVLALMMALSVMVFASANVIEDYPDADEVSAQYSEAVDVLTGMGIYEGDEGGFRPQDTITRAEVAALVYRLFSADTDSSQAHIYAGYATDAFNDLTYDVSWANGYIGYAAYFEYVVGSGVNVFEPKSNITGYELLAILLRAIGYDQNGEFEGDAWATNVAKVATERGIVQGFDTDLSADLTREEVAYLMFNAIRVSQVRYTPAFGYQPIEVDASTPGSAVSVVATSSLGAEKFGLETVVEGNDEYGRPRREWNYDAGVTYVEYVPLATYYTFVTECDVADDVNSGRSFTATTYTNGEDVVSKTINATATTSLIGGQGQTTEVYYENGNWTIVYVDTYLAKVTKVTPATYDTAGHVATPATSELTVSFNNGVSTTTNTVVISGDSYALNSYLLVTSCGGDDFISAYSYPDTEVDVVGVPTVSQVTVRGTLGGDANKYGIETTTGAQYRLNVTSTQTIVNSMINQTYNLYLDAHGNIMMMVPVSTATVNVGVVTAVDFRAVATNKYVAQVDLFLADGTNTTLLLAKNATTFYTQSESSDTSIPAVGALIEFTNTTLDGSTYYYVSETATTGSSTGNTVVTGDTDTLSASLLVDDTTKFILANYKWNYATSRYDVSYIAFTGFKNLPTLQDDTNISYQYVNDGANILIYAANGQDPYTGVTQAQITPDDSYLVLNQVNVTYERYSVYNVVKNGVMTTVNVSNDINDQVDAFIGTNQLVVFDGLTADGGYYTSVKETTQRGTPAMASSNLSADRTVTYSNGVLTVTLGGATKYLTVADDCVVQIVNRDENRVYSATLNHIAQYEPDHSISFDLDNDGYVCNLYIID